ncbi:hypothetical protein GCM10022254_09910 [Actinomadura meridiana]|uniref:Uncharacterized protein n=1 Tax=Actinomadura meridiana TaxID=559626 RepID=A0ABP8BUL0_9ACTN
MSLNVCAGCSSAYAVGLPACPQCGSTEVAGGGAAPTLPQIKVACQTEGCRAAGKVTTMRLPQVALNIVQVPALACAVCGHPVEVVVAWKDNDMPKITKRGGPTNAVADPPAPAAPEPKEGVASSPGSSSQTSPEKPATSPEPKPPAPRKRARTTGSRSGKARTGASTARGTGGGPATGTSEKT